MTENVKSLLVGKYTTAYTALYVLLFELFREGCFECNKIKQIYPVKNQKINPTRLNIFQVSYRSLRNAIPLLLSASGNKE